MLNYLRKLWYSSITVIKAFHTPVDRCRVTFLCWQFMVENVRMHKSRKLNNLVSRENNIMGKAYLKASRLRSLNISIIHSRKRKAQSLWVCLWWAKAAWHSSSSHEWFSSKNQVKTESDYMYNTMMSTSLTENVMTAIRSGATSRKCGSASPRLRDSSSDHDIDLRRWLYWLSCCQTEKNTNKTNLKVSCSRPCTSTCNAVACLSL